MTAKVPNRVTTRSKDASTIDAVLPITLRDFGRFQVLNRSLDAFFHGMGTCWLVLPDRQIDEAKRRISLARYQVIGEMDLVPEMALFPKMQGCKG